MLRTQASLQKLFEASRLRNEKKKQEEQLKYKKAQESTKKALAKQQSINAKKLAQKAQEQPQIEFLRTICIYKTNFIEKAPAEDELYLTREELMEAERRGEGKINWDKFNKIVEQTRQMLNNDKRRRK